MFYPLFLLCWLFSTSFNVNAEPSYKLDLVHDQNKYYNMPTFLIQKQHANSQETVFEPITNNDIKPLFKNILVKLNLSFLALPNSSFKEITLINGHRNVLEDYFAIMAKPIRIGQISSENDQRTLKHANVPAFPDGIFKKDSVEFDMCVKHSSFRDNESMLLEYIQSLNNIVQNVCAQNYQIIKLRNMADKQEIDTNFQTLVMEFVFVPYLAYLLILLNVWGYTKSEPNKIEDLLSREGLTRLNECSIPLNWSKPWSKAPIEYEIIRNMKGKRTRNICNPSIGIFLDSVAGKGDELKRFDPKDITDFIEGAFTLNVRPLSLYIVNFWQAAIVILCSYVAELQALYKKQENNFIRTAIEFPISLSIIDALKLVALDPKSKLLSSLATKFAKNTFRIENFEWKVALRQDEKVLNLNSIQITKGKRESLTIDNFLIPINIDLKTNTQKQMETLANELLMQANGVNNVELAFLLMNAISNHLIHPSQILDTDFLFEEWTISQYSVMQMANNPELIANLREEMETILGNLIKSDEFLNSRNCCTTRILQKVNIKKPKKMSSDKMKEKIEQYLNGSTPLSLNPEFLINSDDK